MALPQRNTPRAEVRLPLVQFANGLVKSDQAKAGRIIPGLTGFHIEAGKYGDDFDRAMLDSQVQRITISHMGGRQVQHWYLGDELTFWPLTAGPVSKSVAGMLRGQNYDATCNAGIGLVWPASDGKGGKGKSKMALQGFIRIGAYLHHVLISVHSTMTNKLTEALLQHFDVLQVADELLQRAGNPVGFHELALMLRTAENATQAKGADGSSTEYYGMACSHPAAPDKEYLNSIWRPKRVVELANEKWQDCVDWAWQFREQVLETAELAEEAA